MTKPLPSLFVSHGSPMLALDGSSAHHFLKGFSDIVARPSNILVVSAHWETETPTVSLTAEPETIHDFGGFARELHEMRYAAPGAPELAEKTARLIEQAGLCVSRHPNRGLDHGAWVPLSLMYPEADIPVAQLSVQPQLGPRHHFAIGQALQKLREEGTLIMASGAVTHDLETLFGSRFDRDAQAPDWVQDFADWVAAAIEDGRVNDLLDYRALAPHAVRNHPTEEHLLPLFVACGAASSSIDAERLHKSNAYGVLAMDVFAMR